VISNSFVKIMYPLHEIFLIRRQYASNVLLHIQLNL